MLSIEIKFKSVLSYPALLDLVLYKPNILLKMLVLFGHLNVQLRLFSRENQASSCMRNNQVLRYTDGTNATPPKELVSNNDIGGTDKVPNPECESWAEQDQVMWSSLLASISPELIE
uniref:Uncharacterized protein n=1 Tax=Aegilops tauschii subsp. strangulata TaxID=200361 RepID=A0A453J9B1_AEGTS